MPFVADVLNEAEMNVLVANVRPESLASLVRSDFA